MVGFVLACFGNSILLVTIRHPFYYANRVTILSCYYYKHYDSGLYCWSSC
jgi:hypothetical protein